MADENKSGIDSTLETGAQAAQVVRGAVKAGKAIAGAAKGAAAGPYGAAAGAIWENRKAIGKIILAVAFLFLLPVLFILMLPSIIFGGLDNPTDANIMNNDTAVMENITEAKQIVWMTLKEDHDEVIKEITKKISNLGENERGVMIDVQLSNIEFNAGLIISQYSASKNHEEINLNDLKQTVDQANNHLFSYVTSSSSKTTEDENREITTHTYTVAYNGDDYFATHVFKLDEQSRKLANDYAQNLALMYGGGDDFQGGVSANVSQEVLRYYELFEKYAIKYGIPDYVDLICSVAMAESGGREKDVMQSSECPHNTKYPQKPGAITEPEYSIDCGVHYLADCLTAAGCTSPLDTEKISLALQGYNYGNGYIKWAIDNYGGYTESNALEFSKKMMAQLGWTSYGNPRYVSAVMKYYIFPSGDGSDGWGSPFVGRNWRLAVSSEFGNRTDPITGKPGEFHTGIDIAYPIGTPINVVKDGVVESATKSSTGYGWHIIVDHGGGLKTLYGHCSKLLVKAGQRVSKGQVIALVGDTGRVTGPHVHINVELNSELQNPRKFLS